MLQFRNLDEPTRAHMLAEIERDIASGLYISSYFNDLGAQMWPGLIRAAAETGDDRTLAQAIRASGGLKRQTTRNTKKGTIYVDVPHNAHETIAESNFSRFYIRALCLRAIADGHGQVIGYRAKQVMEARPGSNEMIGQAFNEAEVLEDVRATMSTAPRLGMPPGPNSGILALLP